VKAIIKLGNSEMVIANEEPFAKPSITGDLWDIMRKVPIEIWLKLYKQPTINQYKEIDFAVALSKDPAMSVTWVEPIEGYLPGKNFIV
jgi:hypothetical protein